MVDTSIFSQDFSHCFSGYGNQRDSVTSNMAYNPDLQAAIPQIMHYLDQMHSGQQHLLHLWQIKKTKLEQCLQLRVFEQECEKVMIDIIIIIVMCKDLNQVIRISTHRELIVVQIKG